MNPLRYLLSAVAGCAAPLLCRVRGHGPWYSVWAGGGLAAKQCGNCGEVRR